MDMEKCYVVILLCVLTTCVEGTSIPCNLKEVGEDKKVCVCNATYCDTIERISKIDKGEFVIIISSKEGLRFNKTIEKFSENITLSGNSIFSWLISSMPSVTFTVNTTSKYQNIMGFGGAFTDSAGINIYSLGKETQEHLIRSYFSENGIEYNLCRLPIGGTDFSTRPYSYDDGLPDPQMKNFSLAKEDLDYKIPLIQSAMEMSIRDIHLIGASWSPPPWMKTNNNYSGFAFLKEECYEAYSCYLLRFLDAYEKHNITIWAISTGNEPSNGVLPIKRFNSLGWLPVSLANWTVNSFGPKLRSSKHNKTKLLAFDDQRLFLTWWIDLLVAADKKVLQYIDGFAVHWYWDFFIGVGVIKSLHEKYPDHFILYTEACQGDKPWEKKVDFGSWERGEKYIADIIQNINNFVTGWLDWNLALDLTGGPTWAKNYVDSPILVNATGDEFYKQPMFYALGHVSKFIERDATRLEISPTFSNGVHAMAVQNPDGRIVIVMSNESNSTCQVSIQIPGKGWINKEMPAHSFFTILC